VTNFTARSNPEQVMNRRSFVSRIILLDGIILLIIAVLLFFTTELAMKWLTFKLSPAEFAEVAPQFQMNHLAMGILLLPIALTTIYCAWGVRKGQHWSRFVSLINGLGILALPALLSWHMGAQFYGSLLFLPATIIIGAVGLTMFLPLLWFPRDPVDHKPNAPLQHP
jgi:hypothetical protein